MTFEHLHAVNDDKGSADEILQRADALEALTETMAERLLAAGEEHAAALRVKAYLLKG
jgi:hypothetical protein